MIKLIRKMNTSKSLLAILFLIIQISCDLYIPTLMANILDNGVVNGDINYIWNQGSFMILLAIIGVFSALTNVFISSKVTNRFVTDLREEIFVKALKMDKVGFDKIGTSSMIIRNSNDVKQIQTLAKTLLQYIFQVPAYLFGGIFFAYRLNSSLAMMFIYALPILIIITIGISLYANPLFSNVQKKVDKLNQVYKEGLDGVRVIRAFNKEQLEYDRYKKINIQYMKTNIKVNTIISIMAPLITFLISIVVLFITGIGAYGVSNGSIEIGTMIGVISYGTQIITGFTLGAVVISMIPRGIVSANRINEVLDMPVILEDNIDDSSRSSYIELEMRNVNFKYNGAEKNALENISFKILEGETLAIVGSTGVGKSTLVDSIMRLFDIDDGIILLNKTNIKDMSLMELRKRISYVPQNSQLFFGTIRENMLIAKSNATDQEIWKALKLANADTFVSKLQSGLDSLVDKNGRNFSGGQKQRLCIARALLKQADIYIFDDSFSALDYKTDYEIRKNIKEFIINPIKIIVAQRISTVIDADFIVVIDNGEIAGYGTHNQLKENNKVYKEIIESQLENKEAI